MQINMLTSKREDIEAAFVEMEGDTVLENQWETTLRWAFEEFPRKRKQYIDALTQELKGTARPHSVEDKKWIVETLDEVATQPSGHIGCDIHGSGGWHRYHIRDNGDIEFSTHHATNEDTWDKAEKLGFRVRRY